MVLRFVWKKARRICTESAIPGLRLSRIRIAVIGLTRKRDWMIRNLGDCFMLDDDIDHLSRIYAEKGEDAQVDPDVAHDIVQMTGYAARQAGAYLFGFQFLAHADQLQQPEPGAALAAT